MAGSRVRLQLKTNSISMGLKARWGKKLAIAVFLFIKLIRGNCILSALSINVKTQKFEEVIGVLS